MINLKKCTYCKYEKNNHFLESKDYSTSKEIFNIVKCEKCNLLYTNPRPKEKDIGKYYLSENYISHTNETKGIFNFMYHTVRKYAIYSKTKLLAQNSIIGKHLDIGSGTGEFLNACKKRGYKCLGIEPSNIARENSEHNFDLDISEDTDLQHLKKNAFDSISMWHVLEHVYDLDDTVKNLSRIINKNGTLIVAVPNHMSFDAKFYKKFWAAWDLPIHLNHFNVETITKIFEENNFDLKKKKGMIFDSFYVSLLSNQYKSGRKQYLKGFLIGLISNISAFFKLSEYSSTIYIFKSRK
jgi:2-polyprenyl-3-methyl-5-hydroxy-6-metoxy-1,4-benzoquinol methylase|tara:strand:- start:635 stop:1522 length:888 start_codon:yes stop_codon:yes gene_type:complete